jgi:hypothetical protein
MRILKIENIDIDETRFSEPRQNRTGSQSVHVSYQPGASSRYDEKIVLQSPTVMIPFGVSEFKGNYYLDMSVRDNTFVQFIKNFEEKVINQAHIKSEEWFGKQITKDTIVQMFKSNMRETKKGFPEIFKAKLYMNDGEYEGDVYDINKNEIKIDALEKMSKIQVIVELVGIYIIPNAFGVTWKVSQIKLLPQKQISGYAFKEEEVKDEADP